jgi:hypothetical protein
VLQDLLEHDRVTSAQRSQITQRSKRDLQSVQLPRRRGARRRRVNAANVGECVVVRQDVQQSSGRTADLDDASVAIADRRRNPGGEWREAQQVGIRRRTSGERVFVFRCTFVVGIQLGLAGTSERVCE